MYRDRYGFGSNNTGITPISDLLPSLRKYTDVGSNLRVPGISNSNQQGFMSQVNTGGIAKAASSTTSGSNPNWLSREAMFGGMNSETGMQTTGWAPTAVTAASSLMGGYLGMKQYGLAKKQLRESKRQFNKNFGAQRQTINTHLEDRQRARVASDPGAHMSVDEYMKKNRV